jgi:hypothetical protein
MTMTFLSIYLDCVETNLGFRHSTLHKLSAHLVRNQVNSETNITYLLVLYWGGMSGLTTSYWTKNGNHDKASTVTQQNSDNPKYWGMH